MAKIIDSAPQRLVLQSGSTKLTLDKDAAHKLCKGCHVTKKAGPTKCGDCHKK